jgi:hypothetical protein
MIFWPRALSFFGSSASGSISATLQIMASTMRPSSSTSSKSSSPSRLSAFRVAIRSAVG